MKLTDMWSPMSDLTPAQRQFSNKVTLGSLALLGVVALLVGAPARAQRMTGYETPSRTQSSFPQRQQTQTPEGYINHTPDSTWTYGSIMGFDVAVQDNGYTQTDPMIIDGPKGYEHVNVNCNVTRDWESWGSNSAEFVHAIVSSYCNWN